MTLEQEARKRIDELLVAAGWSVQDCKAADIHAARGVALREFPLVPIPSPSQGEGQGGGGSGGSGFADYLLYVDGKAAGIIEAKKVGATLTGVEIQSAKYAQGLPASLPAWRRPLPFVYESTGAETHFTNGLDPEPRARSVFAFHKPDTLAGWLGAGPLTLALSPFGGEGADVSSGRTPSPSIRVVREHQEPPLSHESSWERGGGEGKGEGWGGGSS